LQGGILGLLARKKCVGKYDEDFVAYILLIPTTKQVDQYLSKLTIKIRVACFLTHSVCIERTNAFGIQWRVTFDQAGNMYLREFAFKANISPNRNVSTSTLHAVAVDRPYEHLHSTYRHHNAGS